MLKSGLVALCVTFTAGLVSLTAAPQAHAAGLFAKTQVIVDEEIAISNRGSQMRGFKLSRKATLQVSVKGTKNTDKGFDVYLMTTDNYEKFKAGKEFKHFPAFQGLKITGATNTEDIPTGDYVLVIHNKYNLLKGMIVQVKATINP
ncbi:hypothetical protein [Myxococcus vastator]|uniref:hypothetical protein n=1 Tax=Myxococcus vastator TaxID=2709664 RepID=UPI0013D09650|nr:hypothetical protein [Myxococcus vastator]